MGTQEDLPRRPAADYGRHGQQPGRPKPVYRAGTASANEDDAPPAGLGENISPPAPHGVPPQAVKPVPGVDYAPYMPPPPKPRGKWGGILLAFILLVLLGAGVGAGAALWLRGELLLPRAGSSGSVPGAPPTGASSVSSAAGSVPGSGAGGASTPEEWLAALEPRAYSALPLPGEMRAMWFAYLEWQSMDFSSVEVFRASIAESFTRSAGMGLNTVIVSVRPFGDALYPSALFPFSHVTGGAQGQSPGFDPLTVMVEEAHARGLRLEAWVNPYRVQHPTSGPSPLSADNPAALNPALVHSVNGELWYDPGLPEVEALVVKGVAEIVLNYDVDGVHFDDYFYPSGAGDDFDEATWTHYGGGAARDAWRLENVSRMVRLCRAAVKAANPAASFGISVQGNNGANYSQMYADVNRWMAQDDYVDYIMPQLYWGFGHVDAAGNTAAAFGSKVAEWAGYERAQSVRLYAGLAAYRIGLLQANGARAEFGGNGNGDNSEWESGRAMANQVKYLRGNPAFSGFALFRYNFLIQPNDPVSAREVAALSALPRI